VPLGLGGNFNFSSVFTLLSKPVDLVATEFGGFLLKIGLKTLFDMKL